MPATVISGGAGADVRGVSMSDHGRTIAGDAGMTDAAAGVVV